MLRKESPKGKMFHYGYLVGLGVIGISAWYFYDKTIFSSFIEKIIPYDVLFVFMILLCIATSLAEFTRAYRRNKNVR